MTPSDIFWSKVVGWIGVIGLPLIYLLWTSKPTSHPLDDAERAGAGIVLGGLTAMCGFMLYAAYTYSRQ